MVAEASDGQEAIRRAQELAPDLIILDLRIPGDEPARLCEQLGKIAPDARIVLFTAFDDIDVIRGCLASGARGCLVKDTSEADLADDLRRVMAGEVVLDRRVAEKMAVEYATMLQAAPIRLTDREREVLGLLAEGLSNRAIADALCLAESTVKGYVASLLE